ncbi:hypothetical protein GIB67_005352 [Kingdonia uniflora]|uniref:Uncharacterized protein n=1 Tax=Kingdonia uniflora TaxID=39325 RepID=A0A7J7ND31_9MAGN|nr:hypothetical protein GIB67_005352 [Kingdonia uniflora]
MYYARLRSRWEELSHFDSFFEWPASAPSKKVHILPSVAENYEKIEEKTRVFQFLTRLNLDFEYARVHQLNKTPFPTFEEAHTYCLSVQSRRSPIPLIPRIPSETSAMAIRYAYPHHHQFLRKLHIHHHLAFLRYQQLPVILAPRIKSVIIVKSEDI